MTYAHAGSPQLHFWLTRSVARVMGIDLSEALACNLLTEQDYATLVTVCRTCTRVEACKRWLAVQADITGHAPHGCAHTKPLQRLARWQRGSR